MLLDVLVLVVAGAAVWRAGTWLSQDVDALASTTGLGRAFLGMVLLGTATSLPEIATTVSAGVLGNPQLAIGNLMGGVALQVVVLAVADVVESRRSLTVQLSNPVLLLQHVALLLLLALAVAAMAVGEPFVVAGVGSWSVLILGAFLVALRAVWRQENRDRDAWRANDPPAREAEREDSVEEPTPQGGPSYPRMAFSAVLILVSGWFVANSGDSIAASGPLSSTFVGAALVALTTSLPEVSTVIGSLRAGSLEMAVSNIVGTNLIEVALLAVADVSFREGALLAHATRADVFLAALASVLTCLYLAGMLVRKRGTVLRVGYDSAAVVVAYALGIAALAVT